MIMKMKQVCLTSLVIFTCGVSFGAHCSEHRVASSNLTEYASLDNLHVTNVTTAAWQIVGGLEHAIEVRCALLLVTLRYTQEPMRKEDLERRLDDAGLGDRNFRLSLFDMFSRFYGFQREGEPYSETLKEILRSISNTQDSLESDLLRRCNPMRTSPPTADYFTRENCSDMMCFLSPTEKYQFVLLYTFFKGEFMRVCAEFIPQNKDAKSFYQKKNFMRYASLADSSQPTENDVRFLLSIFMKQEDSTNSLIRPDSGCQTNTVEKAKMNGLLK